MLINKNLKFCVSPSFQFCLITIISVMSGAAVRKKADEDVCCWFFFQKSPSRKRCHSLTSSMSSWQWISLSPTTNDAISHLFFWQMLTRVNFSALGHYLTKSSKWTPFKTIDKFIPDFNSMSLTRPSISVNQEFIQLNPAIYNPEMFVEKYFNQYFSICH